MILLPSTLVRAQIPATPAAKDTSGVLKKHIRQRRPGFDLPDSLYISHDSVRGDIDTIVQYDAKDSIVFDVKEKKMTLVDQAEMHFETRDLYAYTIVLDFNTNKLHAYSLGYDSVLVASLSHVRRIIRDTSRTKGRGSPELIDAGTKYDGEIIGYDFKSKRGTVELGTTEMEGGFYYGERIKEVAPGILFVENGRFTTCDAPTPHYYFGSPKMEVQLKDQVFAEPVILYIADVPIFALPFAVFPDHPTGRVSGIIPPNYVENADRGYGLTHLGYYQVISDYADAAIRSDLYTRGGYNVTFDAEYMKRYILGGAMTLNAGYGYTSYNNSAPTQNWLIQYALPNLAIDYQTSLSANLDYSSSGYFQNNATSIADVLTQNASSSASFSHNWEDAGLSFSANYFRNQNLVTGEYSETSPSITLSKSTFFPFAPPPEEATGQQTVWQTLGLSVSVNATRQLTKQLLQVPYDSIYNIPGDTSFHNTELYGFTYNPSITISPKLGYFSFTPSFDYAGAVFLNKITNRSVMLNPVDSSLSFDDQQEKGFHHVYRYDMAVGLSTTLYGIANVGAFGIEAIRHTIVPSISLTYHPDFGNEEYKSYYDPRTKQYVSYDIYQNNLNAGFVSSGRSATIGLSLGNDFEAKVDQVVSKDSTTVSKVKLFDFSVSTGYDAIQKIWSGLSASASSHIGSTLSINGSASYSFYPVNSVGQDSTPLTLASLHLGLLRPVSASLSLNGSFSSPTSTAGLNMDSLRRLVKIESPEDERETMLGGYYPGQFVQVPFRPTWNVSYGISYTQYYSATSTTGTVITRNLSGNLSLTFSLTRNWSFTSGATYDFVNKSLVVPDFRVHRDLHCWEMNFDYRPTGIIRGYNFEIRVKADMLKDLKLTRQESEYGNF